MIEYLIEARRCAVIREAGRVRLTIEEVISLPQTTPTERILTRMWLALVDKMPVDKQQEAFIELVESLRKAD